MSKASLRLELFTSDLERSVAFYENVLGFVREGDSPGYVEVRRGDVRFGIGLAGGLPDRHPIKPKGGQRVGLGIEIVIEVEDVDAVCHAVEASGHPIVSPLKTRPWGLRDFRIVDPDGFYIRVTSQS